MSQKNGYKSCRWGGTFLKGTFLWLFDSKGCILVLFERIIPHLQLLYLLCKESWKLLKWMLFRHQCRTLISELSEAAQFISAVVRQIYLKSDLNGYLTLFFSFLVWFHSKSDWAIRKREVLLIVFDTMRERESNKTRVTISHAFIRN